MPSCTNDFIKNIKIPQTVRNIIRYYSSDNIGTKTNLTRLLMTGALGGSGKIIILPVDQGLEHGPDKSFIDNQAAYDPYYHPSLALEGGFNGYASTLGMIEMIADEYAASLPLILKLNSGNNFSKGQGKGGFDQSINSSVKDAVQLGCVGIGFTIYPGSEKFHEMLEEAREVIKEAKSYGLFSVIWSYPRGTAISEYESAIDVVCYATHIAASIGAHIIKVKIPNNKIYQQDLSEKYSKTKIDLNDRKTRIEQVMKSAFNNKRLVLFSGGEFKDEDTLFQEISDIKYGNGSGSILGRNIFQRRREEALKMIQEIILIYSL